MQIGNSITIKTQTQLDTFIENVKADFKEHKFLKITIESGIRSIPQNRALHLYCEQVAKELNDAGYDVNTFFKEGFTVPFSQHIVKDNLWRPIQKAVTGKESTTRATKKEYTEIYEHLNAKLAEKGIHVPFPSQDSFMRGEV